MAPSLQAGEIVKCPRRAEVYFPDGPSRCSLTLLSSGQALQGGILPRIKSCVPAGGGRRSGRQFICAVRWSNNDGLELPEGAVFIADLIGLMAQTADGATIGPSISQFQQRCARHPWRKGIYGTQCPRLCPGRLT